MNERPWWFYAIQIVAIALAIAGVALAHVYETQWNVDQGMMPYAFSVAFGLIAIAAARW